MCNQDKKVNFIYREAFQPIEESYGRPVLTERSEEVIDCVNHGLNNAAIIMSTLLVESALSLILNIEYKRIGKRPYKGAGLSAIFKRIKKEDFLSDREIIPRIRKLVKTRNNYVHENLDKITDGVIFPNVTHIDTKTKKTSVKDMSVDESPFLQGLAKRGVDEVNVMNIVCESLEIVRSVLILSET